MTELILITVGTLKESYLKDACLEYQKRLGEFARIKEINVKEELIKNEDDKGQIASALEREGEKILSSIPKDAYVISLCVEGDEVSSPELARLIEKQSARTGRIALIIGSSYGLSDKVKQSSDMRLSFSKLTFPHQLMRVILLEAVYRAFTISAGKRYHK